MKQLHRPRVVDRRAKRLAWNLLSHANICLRSVESKQYDVNARTQRFLYRRRCLPGRRRTTKLIYLSISNSVVFIT